MTAGKATGPLTGSRILDLTRLLPGAYATSVLADLGAEVIKIERPGSGDPMREYEPKLGESSAFTWVTDRNKRSVALDLSAPEGVAAVHRIARESDIVVEGFRPGVADRLGVGYEDLAAVNPAIVYCSITGYGSVGTLRDEAGHDLNYIGRAGLLATTGTDGTPAIPSIQIADIAGGALYATIGMLACLDQARRTGKGDHIDISMMHGAFALQTIDLAGYFATGRSPRMGRELLTGAIPCYQVYACADGRYLTVAALEPQFWRALCETLGRTEHLGRATDPEAIQDWRDFFSTRSRDEWLAMLEGVDACVGPVNDLEEALADPQLRALDAVVEIEGPDGSTPQIAPVIRLRSGAGREIKAAPGLGADTVAVLEEVGIEPSQIEEMLAAGIAQAGE